MSSIADDVKLVFKLLHPNQYLNDITLLNIYSYNDMIIKLKLSKIIIHEEILYLEWLYNEYIHYIFSVGI